MERAGFDLNTLEKDSTLQVVIEDRNKPFTYLFNVLEAGQLPRCSMTEMDSEGNIAGPANVFLEGSGQWTTPAQNPTQSGDLLFGRPRQERAFSIYYGHIYTGEELTVLREDNRQRLLLNGKIETIKKLTGQTKPT